MKKLLYILSLLTIASTVLTACDPNAGTPVSAETVSIATEEPVVTELSATEAPTASPASEQEATGASPTEAEYGSLMITSISVPAELVCPQGEMPVNLSLKFTKDYIHMNRLAGSVSRVTWSVKDIEGNFKYPKKEGEVVNFYSYDLYTGTYYTTTTTSCPTGIWKVTIESGLPQDAQGRVVNGHLIIVDHKPFRILKAGKEPDYIEAGDGKITASFGSAGVIVINYSKDTAISINGINVSCSAKSGNQSGWVCADYDISTSWPYIE